MNLSIKKIINENVKDKAVLLRADLNIPMLDGKVTDFTRVERLIPTIEYLKLSGAKVIICSHFGRPNGEINKNYSLKPLVDILSKAINAEIKFAESCIGKEVLEAKKLLKSGEILLLENVRFNKGEA